jgi:hypothetical protein
MVLVLTLLHVIGSSTLIFVGAVGLTLSYRLLRTDQDQFNRARALTNGLQNAWGGSVDVTPESAALGIIRKGGRFDASGNFISCSQISDREVERMLGIQ